LFLKNQLFGLSPRRGNTGNLQSRERSKRIWHKYTDGLAERGGYKPLPYKLVSEKF